MDSPSFINIRMVFSTPINGVWRLIGALLWVSATPAAISALLTDLFVNRETISTTSALVTGSNAGASIEAGEPRHAGKIGGHSVWISWIAPTNGLVTISTDGSSFDTLLGVYVMESGDDPPLRRLRPAADDDDDELSSLAAARFSVRAGKRYEIAVDGFGGATGEISLSIDLLTIDDLLPQIVRFPSDLAVRQGDTVILTIDVNREAVANMEMNWSFNGANLDEEDQPTMIIRNFQPTNTGTYRLRVVVADTKFYSPAVELQINSEGDPDVLARNKLQDAQSSGLHAGGKAVQPKLGGTVNRGYNGSQVFNTAYATRDPLEPMHCGVPGGPTYWFSYQPPANGALTLDTQGSSYDTLLAVYTYDPPLTGYESLIPVACDNNGGTNGRASWLRFQAEAARTYFIVIDGVNGARGTARLNYSLAASNPPPPIPVITRQPKSQIVAPGNTIVLDVSAAGGAPLRYQWFRNNYTMGGQTNASLTLSSVTASATYRVGVSNAFGAIVSSNAVITALTRPGIGIDPSTRTAVASFPAARGYQYRIEAGDLSGSNSWHLLQTALTDPAGVIRITNSVDAVERQFLRLLGP